MVSDIELEIGKDREAGTFNVKVLHSAAGGHPKSRFVLDTDGLLARHAQLESTVLASGVRRRRLMPAAEQPLQEVGQQLFEAIFTGDVKDAYRASLGAVQETGKRLRVALRLTAPELAALPWESMYDQRARAYLCRTEPLIRHVDAPYTPQPLEVHPPLRILGLVSSPTGLPRLDMQGEQQGLEQALARPIAAGLVELTWAPDASWSTIHDLLLEDTWHILHFIGHGDFDPASDEGVLALAGTDGRADLVEASRLTDLLSEADPTPQLVVLNSCSSGQEGAHDLFSGTAAALVHGGISAVAAMQFSISDDAALRFARGFYAAIARGKPVDEAVRSGRIEILGAAQTLEWVTPVLYVRGGITQLFRLTGPPSPPPPRERDRTTAKPTQPEPSQEAQKATLTLSPAPVTPPPASTVRMEHPAPPPGPMVPGRAPARRPGPTVLSVLWALLPTLTFGVLTPILAPIPFAHAAARLHERRLLWAACAYGLGSLTLWILMSVSTAYSWLQDASVSSLVVLGVVASVHAFKLRPRVFSKSSPPTTAGPGS